MQRLLTALLTLAICASASAATDKVVHVYNWNDYIDPQVLADFEKLTGIRVDYQTFSSAEELKATLASGKSFDVIAPSNDYLPQLIKEQRLQPLDKAR